MSYTDMKGKVFGRLTVIEKDAERTDKTNREYWICQCSCGNLKSARKDMLGRKTNSCGCLKLEQNKRNLGRFKHGKSHSRIATIWYHINSRCYNPKDTNYKNYGALGVTVCEEWRNDFLVFEKWALENGYSKNLSIDRIDVKGAYEPNNCRWADFETQINNKRGTLRVVHNGVVKSLAQAYKEEKPPITYQTAKTRYHQGIRDTNELFRDRKKTPR
jgi:hypothetical protein